MKEKEFFEKLKQSQNPVVVDFWAPWCGPCRMIEPAMKKLAETYTGRVEVWKVNADEHPEVLRSLRIYGIPTLISFRQGQEISRHTGAASQPVLATLFEAALSGVKSVRSGPAPVERLLRLVAGSAMLLLSFANHFSGWYLLLTVLGAAVAFSAVYDRCPIYRAVTSYLKTLFQKGSVDKS